jgi:hypothetical protein
MALFNGEGLWKKIGMIVGTISAILIFYWQLGDRVQARIDTTILLSETKTITKIVEVENEFVSSLDKFQRQQDTRYWMQLREMARIELARIARELIGNPNNTNLLSDQKYWQEVYDRATRELDKILNP